jgi:DNA mismatch repair ATPase MutL
MVKQKSTNSKSAPAEKRGAPKGNVNGWKHGMRSTTERYGLILGEAPRKVKQVQLYAAKLRRSLEEIVMTHKGKLTILDQAYITTACRFEKLAQLANRWLGEKYDTHSTMERLQLAKAVADASASRDKALEKLGLDQEEVKTLTLTTYLQDQQKDRDA